MKGKKDYIEGEELNEKQIFKNNEFGEIRTRR